MQVVYLVLLFLIAYPYVVYPLISFMVSRFRKIKTLSYHYPEITVVIAAYNEIEYIAQKIENTLALDYPPELLKVLVVTDGSTDGTEQLVLADHRVRLLHQPERKGKTSALNRAFEHVSEGIVVCTDANTMLNKMAVKELVKHFQDSNIGAVAGEKRVLEDSNGIIPEGYYWRYESKLRKWDALAYSVPGAVGELYAIRREEFTPIPEETICDDLLITMQVLEQGKRVVFEPLAYGVEKKTETIAGEWNRKTRIAAGCIQFLLRFKFMRFFRQHPFAAFQLFSRKILRWVVVPYGLIVLLLLGSLILFQGEDGNIIIIIYLQCLFFCWAFLGWLLRKLRLPGFIFFPFYFLLANAAVIVGTIRYLNGENFVLWQKARD